ncbi:uncharacterized protein BROUX77_003743 [Berkeleyomyces rouxiae]|uniref:uncharacterized protein n=1 Tax=Berkeleyomyces rouxiae TaxID=2035830 RepID=UPI003B78A4DB
MTQVSKSADGAGPCPLLSLPVELTTRILVLAGSPADLRAVASSCQALRSIVRQNEAWIVGKVLPRLISPRVVPAALLVRKARNLPKAAGDPQARAARDFIQKYLDGQVEDKSLSASAVCTIADLEALMPLHCVVESMRDRFIAHCMKQIQRDNLAGWDTTALFSPGLPPSTSEKARIEMALYHYHLFCVLFGHDEPNPYNYRWTLQRKFRSCFAPWELEQIASVFDTIRVDVYRAFRDVARHDITYGLNMVEYDKRHSPWMRHILETGLEYMNEVLAAPDFESRRKVLMRQHVGDSIPRSCSFCPMTWNLPNGNEMPGHDFAPFSSRNMAIDPPRVPEDDSGPEDTWRWICQTGIPNHADLPLSPFKRWILRHQGYIFWDSWRVQSSQMLSQRFREPFFQESHFHVREQLALEGLPNTESYSSRMVSSWLARKLIFLDGGRGYWDFTDTKRIEWGHSKDPRF